VLIAVVTDLEKVTALTVLQGRHGKVIEQQHIDLRQPEQHPAHAAIRLGYGQFAK
jgi:hypothetical protein